MGNDSPKKKHGPTWHPFRMFPRKTWPDRPRKQPDMVPANHPYFIGFCMI